MTVCRPYFTPSAILWEFGGSNGRFKFRKRSQFLPARVGLETHPVMNLQIRLNLASPLWHEGQHGGGISSESCEFQVWMKRGQERGDGSVTVSYGIRCHFDQTHPE